MPDNFDLRLTKDGFLEIKFTGKEPMPDHTDHIEWILENVVLPDEIDAHLIYLREVEIAATKLVNSKRDMHFNELLNQLTAIIKKK